MRGGGGIGLLFLIVALLLATVLLAFAKWEQQRKTLVVTGLWLRVIGSLAYLFIVGAVYGGGDYLMYYAHGLDTAEILVGDGVTAFWDSYLKRQWWGTSFIVHLAAVVLSIIGPTLAGAFLVFAIVSYLGIIALGLAFMRAFPNADWRRYLLWITLFPSLWFWPAALGKDAVVLCGVGLATLGYVGKRGRANWFVMGVGGLLVFCIRPQVAATLAFAFVAGHWLGAVRRLGVINIIQGLVLLGLGIAAVTTASGTLGFSLFSPEEVEGYLGGRAARSNYGGSAFGVESVSPWLAPFNVLFRPFPWEASGIAGLLSSLEIVVLWSLAWFQRRELKAFVRANRHSRVFWTAVVFVLAYSTALGMSLTNTGIVARQRVHILPFLFMFFAGTPGRQNLSSFRQIPTTARGNMAEPVCGKHPSGSGSAPRQGRMP